jgi:hypothetical protein
LFICADTVFRFIFASPICSARKISCKMTYFSTFKASAFICPDNVVSSSTTASAISGECYSVGIDACLMTQDQPKILAPRHFGQMKLGTTGTLCLAGGYCQCRLHRAIPSQIFETFQFCSSLYIRCSLQSSCP